MLFDLDKHKFKVLAEMVITAVATGAAASIVMVYTTGVDIFTVEGLRELAKSATSGAVGGLIGLFRSLPRNPAAFGRRADAPQVVEAAAKLGAIEPDNLAGARRKAAVKSHEIAAKVDKKNGQMPPGADF